MYLTKNNLTGFLYLAPAVLFVLAFTLYPLIQMAWMSLHQWPLLGERKFIGLTNFTRAFNDKQFWVSLNFTLKYTLWITPILMILGYLIALLTAPNTPLFRFTRTVVFIPVVIGLGTSSVLWYWLFSYDFGLVNRALVDLGIVAERIIWFGADPETAMWAVNISIVWKVLGFGMILFVAAIQAIPSETSEAVTVDGAGPWQRVRHVTLPLTYRTILLVTLISVIGSLLAFDQFYIMTAGQPFNQTATSVFWIYFNSFPYFRLGYGAALSLILAVIILLATIGQIVLSRRSHS
jgi:multiple sugar transport system permease protein